MLSPAGEWFVLNHGNFTVVPNMHSRILLSTRGLSTTLFRSSCVCRQKTRINRMIGVGFRHFSNHPHHVPLPNPNVHTPKNSWITHTHNPFVFSFIPLLWVCVCVCRFPTLNTIAYLFIIILYKAKQCRRTEKKKKENEWARMNETETCKIKVLRNI